METVSYDVALRSARALEGIDLADLTYNQRCCLSDAVDYGIAVYVDVLSRESSEVIGCHVLFIGE